MTAGVGAGVGDGAGLVVDTGVDTGVKAGAEGGVAVAAAESAAAEGEWLEGAGAEATSFSISSTTCPGPRYEPKLEKLSAKTLPLASIKTRSGIPLPANFSMPLPSWVKSLNRSAGQGMASYCM